MNQIRAIWEVVRDFAPYAAIELILPGGTLLAILCWLYRRRLARAPGASPASTSNRSGSLHGSPDLSLAS